MVIDAYIGIFIARDHSAVWSPCPKRLEVR